MNYSPLNKKKSALSGKTSHLYRIDLLKNSLSSFILIGVMVSSFSLVFIIAISDDKGLIKQLMDCYLLIM